MRKWAARRIVTVALFLITFTLLASMQPVFFGVQTYFGINPLYHFASDFFYLHNTDVPSSISKLADYALLVQEKPR